MCKGDGISPHSGSAVAVILGASEFKAGFAGHPNYAASARGFVDYLRSTQGLNLRADQICNQFDTDLGGAEALKQAREFIKHATQSTSGESKVRFVIVYYVGHGSFDAHNGGLFFPLRSSDKDFPSKTGITASDLWSLIRLFENNLIFYVILDCCFAGKFTSEAQSASDDLLKMESAKMPRRGTGFLGAAAAEAVAINTGTKYTMFTEGLLHALTTGVPNGRDTLSLDDIFHSTKEYISKTFRERAVTPQIHSPKAPDGPVSPIRLFPNPGAPTRRVGPGVASDAVSDFCRKVYAAAVNELAPRPNWSDPYAFKWPGAGRYFAFADLENGLNEEWDDDPVLYAQLHILEPKRPQVLYTVRSQLVWHREGDRGLHGNKGISARFEGYVSQLKARFSETNGGGSRIRVEIGEEADLEVSIRQGQLELNEQAVQRVIADLRQLWNELQPLVIEQVQKRQHG